MKENTSRALRSIPSMEELLALPAFRVVQESISRDAVKFLLNEVLEQVRGEILEGNLPREDVADLVVARAEELLAAATERGLRPLLNATGVVVHTNLGRAPLPQCAVREAADVAAGYASLEFSARTGKRAGRDTHVDWMLRFLTGAEAVLPVNNNAAALLLAVTALARNREVVVANGELVEIGGSFRIPDILDASGARMRAVGCTNSVRPEDYRSATNEETALLLRIHPSNYRIEGYTTTVSRREFVAVARETGVYAVEDLGSGLLLPLEIPDLPPEATVAACIETGLDVVTFSGDKLLGGPQIGCIAGKKEVVREMRRHPLYRAVRPDKMALAAFESVLRMYVRGTGGDIPVIAMLRADGEALREKAHRLYGALRGTADDTPNGDFAVEVVATEDAVGGGAHPARPLPGWGLAVSLPEGMAPEAFLTRCRMAETPIVGIVRGGRPVFSVRTLLPGEERAFAETLSNIFERGER